MASSLFKPQSLIPRVARLRRNIVRRRHRPELHGAIGGARYLHVVLGGVLQCCGELRLFRTRLCRAHRGRTISSIIIWWWPPPLHRDPISYTGSRSHRTRLRPYPPPWNIAIGFRPLYHSLDFGIKPGHGIKHRQHSAPHERGRSRTACHSRDRLTARVARWN